MAFKFGRKQIGKPTPASIGFKVLVISIVAPILQLWLGSSASQFIPAKLSAILISILGLIILIVNAIKPLFGVDVDQSFVPTEDVKEVEDKPEEPKKP